MGIRMPELFLSQNSLTNSDTAWSLAGPNTIWPLHLTVSLSTMIAEMENFGSSKLHGERTKTETFAVWQWIRGSVFVNLTVV